MRGLNRTAPLKFDHPGLDTAATRDGERLLIQNDIGTNDAHVLVHPGRRPRDHADLFRPAPRPPRVLPGAARSRSARSGRGWSRATNAELNQGAAYSVGTAQFDCADDAARRRRAGRHRLAHRVPDRLEPRAQAPAGLRRQGRCDRRPGAKRRGSTSAHRAWLQVGGERLVFAAMQAAGEGAFRIGDRLDEVIGVADARAFLVAVMRLACDALRRGQPAALVADETRMLLAQHVRQRSSEFDLLAEHAVVLPGAGAGGQRRPGARRRALGQGRGASSPRARRRGSARPTTW